MKDDTPIYYELLKSNLDDSPAWDWTETNEESHMKYSKEDIKYTTAVGKHISLENPDWPINEEESLDSADEIKEQAVELPEVNNE